MNRKIFFFLLVLALLFKLGLFAYAMTHAPGSMEAPDTEAYVQLAGQLYSKGAFALEGPGGSLQYNLYRTPGYPLFLAVFHHGFKIPFPGVMFLQVLLTIFTAWVLFQTARGIDPKTSALAALIFLFDFPTAIVSMRILTEALYVFLISLFLWGFLDYLKRGEKKTLLISALFLAAAAYVRPVSYYLGGAAALFILYADPDGDRKVSLKHAALFGAVVYFLLGLWQMRNYLHHSQAVFAGVGEDNLKGLGLFAVCSKKAESFLSLAGHCTWDALHAFIRLMTKPGLLKYYHSPLLAKAGQIIAVPFLVFQLAGFILGCLKIRKNIQYQFVLLVFFYFCGVSVLALSTLTGDRYRVPVVPCIALLSAYGWLACPGKE